MSAAAAAAVTGWPSFYAPIDNDHVIEVGTGEHGLLASCVDKELCSAASLAAAARRSTISVANTAADTQLVVLTSSSHLHAAAVGPWCTLVGQQRQ